MSHSVYASQSTSTLRVATSIMTDVGNNKQKCSSDGAFQHGVTWSKCKHCRDTFQKFKAERECYNSSLTSVAQALPSRSQGPGGQHTGHHANIMQFLFQKMMGGVLLSLRGQGMSRRFTDTIPRQSASYTVVSLWPYI